MSLFTVCLRTIAGFYAVACEVLPCSSLGQHDDRDDREEGGHTVRNFDRYQSGIDHSLIDLGSGMVNWYLRIPLSSLILLSSSGAVFSRDPCIGLLQCSGKRKNMAGNGRKQPEKVGYGKKSDGI